MLHCIVVTNSHSYLLMLNTTGGIEERRLKLRSSFFKLLNPDRQQFELIESFERRLWASDKDSNLCSDLIPVEWNNILYVWYTKDTIGQRASHYHTKTIILWWVACMVASVELHTKLSGIEPVGPWICLMLGHVSPSVWLRALFAMQYHGNARTHTHLRIKSSCRSVPITHIQILQTI